MPGTSSSDSSSNPAKRDATAAFSDAVDHDFHMKQLGENACPEYTNLGLGSNILALSQLVRDGDPTPLVDLILTQGTAQDVADLVVLMFVTRNTRGGKGEKDLAFIMFLRFWRMYPQTAKKLIPLFPHYGYWKDLLLLLEMLVDEVASSPARTDLFDACLAVMVKQLQEDVASMERYKSKLAKAKEEPNGGSCDNDLVDKLEEKGPKLSLLAKWLPREGSHFDKSINFVKRFAALMWPTLATTTTAAAATSINDDDELWKCSAKAKYRKTVAELTSYYGLPEVLLSAKREEEINFQKVASKATFKLSKTFLNETKKGAQRSDDPKRIRLAERFVDVVITKGLKGGQVMPHEIVGPIMKNASNFSPSMAAVLDAQWKDIWKGVVEQVKAKAQEEGLEFNPTRMIPLSDVSSSMTGLPMEVAIALGIGLSEITHEAFRDMVLTFETKPQWHKLNPTDNIVQKVQSLKNAEWGGSTNFEAAYKLILEVAVRHKLRREDLPVLIVFSDMQFNEATGLSVNSLDTMHDNIKKMFKKVAATLNWTDDHPTPMVFWNLRNTGGHPVSKDTEGTVLLSGFSPSLLKLVMNGEAMREDEVELVQADGTVKRVKVRVTPEEVLRKMLDDSMYDPVREILVSSMEGKLVEYEIPLNGPLATSSSSSSSEKVDEFELV